MVRLFVLVSLTLLPLGNGLAADLRVPAATAYVDPDVRGARVTNTGISRWHGPDQTISWFGEMQHAGELSAQLELRLPNGKDTQLQLTIGQQSRTVSVQGSGSQIVIADFGSFDTSEKGYHS